MHEFLFECMCAQVNEGICVWLYFHECIQMCICMYVFMYLQQCVTVCICKWTHICVHVNVLMYVCICEYVWMHLWARVSVCLYKCACLSECKVMTVHVICLERKWFREKCGLKSEWPHELEYYLCHLLAVHPWESCLTSLDLHLLVYIIDIKTYLPYRDVRRIIFTNRSKTLNRYLVLI